MEAGYRDAGAGFFIGDGAGVGKGRQIAGIIMDNFARGRRQAVWLSTSSVRGYSLQSNLPLCILRQCALQDLRTCMRLARLRVVMELSVCFCAYERDK